MELTKRRIPASLKVEREKRFGDVEGEGKDHTSINTARSTTILVTYPRTRPIILLATDDEPISTSI